MAKIQSENVVITFSKLVKDGSQEQPIVTVDLVENLSAVAEELAGAGIIVEVQTA